MDSMVDIVAETSVLGSILLNEEALDVVQALGLQAEHFGTAANRAVYGACESCLKRGTKADATTLIAELRMHNAISDIPSYLSGLVDAVPAVANVEYYGRIVLDCARRRALLLAVRKATADLGNGAKLEDVRSGVAAALESTLALNQQEHGVLKSFLAANVGLKAAPTLPWGWYRFDQRTGGIPEAALIVIGAYPSVGKTAVATSALAHLARAGIPVAFFSVEMSAAQLITALVARQSGLPYHDVRRGGAAQIRGEKGERVAEVVRNMGEWPFYLVVGSISASAITATARMLVRKHGVKLIAVDYLQLLAMPNAESRRVATDETTRMLKGFAQSTGVSVVLLSQLSRQAGGGDNPRPNVHSLKESGGILEAADMVVLLYRPQFRQPEGDNTMLFIVDKNRFGEAGFDVRMTWDGPRMAVSDPDDTIGRQ